MQRPTLILYTDGLLADPIMIKTATALLRFEPERVKAVLDVPHAGQPLGAVCPLLASLDIPVVDSLEGVAQEGDALVVGFATIGGSFTTDQRSFLLAAAARGVTVINGLHDLLPGPNMVNLRAFDAADRAIARGQAFSSTRVLAAGTSNSVGKMTTTVSMVRILQERGVRADWLATGQTGMLLRGAGHAIDAIPADFMTGVIENDLLAVEQDADVVVIEGQGSLVHPAFGVCTFALVQATRPQYYVVCHRLGVETTEQIALPLQSPSETVAAHEHLHVALGIESQLLGVSLDSSLVSVSEYEAFCREVEREFAVACCDPVREGAEPLADALMAQLASTS
jgi:uncharacterized NAD-dependent epimerase/dehydratase family protein